MEKQEIICSLKKIMTIFNDLKKTLNIDFMIEELKIKEKKTTEDNFWLDKKNSQIIINEIKNYKNKLSKIENIESKYEEFNIYLEIYDSENTSEIYNELIELYKDINNSIKELELEVLLSEEYDSNNAIIEIHPGAGGTESMDWAEMLYKMYEKWSKNNKFNLEIYEYAKGEEAGLKKVSFIIKGNNSFGLLKSEKGVHRLIRISPFDSGKRRHTSFASVEVIPELSKDIDLNISSDDIKIDTYRSSGAGGQSVNTTDSAVRITHIPTNLVVTCQNERSQIKNKEIALNILKNKILNLRLNEKNEELKKIKGEKRSNSFGSQIRSYIFHPYSLVKDHRTKEENSNSQKILEGNIDDFIYSYLKYIVGGKNE